MRNNNRGLGMIEVVIVIGLLATISLVTVSLMNNMFKSVSSVQKNANRTDTVKAISTALSNKNTCNIALGAGTMAIPASWAPGAAAAIAIPRIRIGNDLIAEVGTAINDIRMTQMRLEMSSGPYPVQFNTAAAGANPVLRNYRRYFAKLIVSPQKVGGNEGNVGGENLKDNELRVGLLVSDTNILQECFGGMDESDLNALCERGFDGQFSELAFPWCTPMNMSIGIPRAQMHAQFPRFAVYEKQNPVNSTWDVTMALYGNGAASGNGPGLWFVRNPTTGITNTGDLAVIGYAGRANAYGTGTKVGDLVVSNRSSAGDLYVGSLDASLRFNQNNRVITADRPFEVVAPASGFNPALSVYSPNGQGNVVVSGASDGGQTYSALYLAAAAPATVLTNSWVFAHKAATSGNLDSLHIARWTASGMRAAIAVTPNNMFIGINNNVPTEQLDVAGGILASGNIRANGNISAGGTVTAASDRRLKRDIATTSFNLEKILALQPVSYVWKSDEAKHKHLGFIAQEVQKVIPEAVNKITADTLGISAMDILSVVVGAIQELYQEVKLTIKQLGKAESDIQEMRQVILDLQARQTDLEMQNKILKDQIKDLKESSK